MPELSPPRALALMAIALLAALPGGCRSRRLPLKPPASCGKPEVVSCLQGYAFEELDPSALERIATEAIRECFAEDRDVLLDQSSCLPLEMGVDRQLGRAVELHLFWSDAGGRVVPFYRDRLDKETCCQLGGAPVLDFAWSSGYMGCAVATARGSKSREKACGASR